MLAAISTLNSLESTNVVSVLLTRRLCCTERLVSSFKSRNIQEFGTVSAATTRAWLGMGLVRETSSPPSHTQNIYTENISLRTEEIGKGCGVSLYETGI